MPFAKILTTDKLQTGFRAKFNANVDLLPNGYEDNGDGSVRITRFDGSFFDVAITGSFYIKSEVDALIAAISPAPSFPEPEEIPVPDSTPIVIDWINDIIPSGTFTYSQRFGDLMPKFQAWESDGADNYTPSSVTPSVYRPEGIITTVTLSDIFPGIISIS